MQTETRCQTEENADGHRQREGNYEDRDKQVERKMEREENSETNPQQSSFSWVHV